MAERVECIDCLEEADCGVFCHECAPTYEVRSYQGCMYKTCNLRRAWEAERYYLAQDIYDTVIVVPERVDSMLSFEEDRLLRSWDVYNWNRLTLAPVHLCLQDETVLPERKAA